MGFGFLHLAISIAAKSYYYFNPCQAIILNYNILTASQNIFYDNIVR
jgi:hypothetical protein